MDRASEHSSRRIYAVAAILLLAPVYWRTRRLLRGHVGHELEAPEETKI